jgi:hypothetical protein
MQLIVENAPDREHKLQVTFDAVAPLLGIDKIPGTVTVRVRPNTGHQSASTKNTLGPNNAAEVTLNPCRPDCSCVYKSFVHELVHVDQMVKGRLKVDHDAGTIVWNGINIPAVIFGLANGLVMGLNPLQEAVYRALPWEVEAREMADNLYKEVTKAYATEVQGDVGV